MLKWIKELLAAIAAANAADAKAEADFAKAYTAADARADDDRTRDWAATVGRF